MAAPENDPTTGSSTGSSTDSTGSTDSGTGGFGSDRTHFGFEEVPIDEKVGKVKQVFEDVADQCA